MADQPLLSLPASIVAFFMAPHLESNNLLSLRVACTRLRALLEDSEEAEEIWRRALIRDFNFDENDDGSSAMNHRMTLHVSAVSELKRMDSMGDDDETERRRMGEGGASKSVFGYPAVESVFTATSAFHSWKQWRKASLRYYEVPQSLLTDDGEDVEVLRARFGLGQAGFRNLNGPYFLRAAMAWSKIEQWCDNLEQSGSIGRKIKGTLLRGTSYFQTRLRRQSRGNERGLLACQALHAFHGGQEEIPFPPTDNEEDMSKLFCGLMGGYSAYNSVVCTRLLRASDLDVFNGSSSMIDYIPIAASRYLDKKVFDLDVNTGRVYLRLGDSRIPAVNFRRGTSADDDDMDDDEEEQSRPRLDAVLLWFEEYASRLETGSICVGRIITNEPISDGILLFPTLNARDEALLPATVVGGPQGTPVRVTSRAVTRGVEVVASAVFAGEFLDRGMAFMYSIRIRLLTPDDEGYVPPSARGYDTCQLRSRHWQIHDRDQGTTEHVRGDGVIGLYPLLREGGYRNDSGYTSTNLEQPGSERLGTFIYQSCSGMTNGSFAGTLQFVPGSLRDPTGDSFDVVVAPFVLDPKPKFLF